MENNNNVDVYLKRVWAENPDNVQTYYLDCHTSSWTNCIEDATNLRDIGIALTILNIQKQLDIAKSTPGLYVPHYSVVTEKIFV